MLLFQNSSGKKSQCLFISHSSEWSPSLCGNLSKYRLQKAIREFQYVILGRLFKETFT